MSVSSSESVNGVQRRVALHLRRASVVRDVLVGFGADDVSAGEVFDALGLEPTTLIDGRPAPRDLSVPAASVLRSGSRLVSVDGEHCQDGDELAAASGVLEIRATAGDAVGESVRLVPGRHRIECGGGWCLVEVAPSDGGHAGPWHEVTSELETVEVGGSYLVLGRPVLDASAPTTVIHRPPRPERPSRVEPIPPFVQPPAVRAPQPLSWATVLGPVPVAIVMAVLFRPLFAVFAAMGPVIAFGRWFELRRRFRRDTVRHEREVDRRRRVFDQQRAEQHQGLVRRRWQMHPYIAELRRRAHSASVRLWERRLGDSDALRLVVGVGPGTLSPLLDGPAGTDPSPVAPHQLPPVPWTISMRDHAGVGVAGSRDLALGVVRSAVLQLVTLHGPADVEVGLLAHPDHVESWEWLKWLPHLDRQRPIPVNAVPGGPTRGGGDRDQARSGRSALGRPGREMRDGAGDGPVLIVIVDDPLADVAAMVRDARDAGVELKVLAVAEATTALPAVCDAILDLSNRSLVFPDDGEPFERSEGSPIRESFRPVAVDATFAEEWALDLTRFRDPEARDRVFDGELEVDLMRILGVSKRASVLTRWERWSPGHQPKATLGVTERGRFEVDLVEDGPHMLIAGTTGSGKSELLRTLVLALATDCAPCHLNLVLIDFKGGGAFDALAGLPHVVGTITDLDHEMIHRGIEGLRAELVRREQVYRRLAVSTFADAERALAELGHEPLPRLVVVIDEFAALAADHADVLEAFVALASRGRSLGMHLVLATQRPSGVVDQKIRANTNLGIALRVQDPHDSNDVIGTPDAAFIDRRTPGAAIARVGGDAPVAFRCAYTGHRPIGRPRVEVQEFVLCPAIDGEPARGEAAAECSGRSCLEILAGLVTQAGATTATAVRPMWAPPLPTSLDWVDLAGHEICDGDGDIAASASSGLVLGLADRPEHQQQLSWRWDPAQGALAIFGSSATCAGKALVGVAMAMVGTAAADAVHLYLVDGEAGALANLRDIPHVGAYISAQETDRVGRCLDRLEAMVRERPIEVDGWPRVLLAVDNLGAVLDACGDLEAASLVDRLVGLARDGAPRGVHLVLSARSARDIPHRLSQQLPRRLAMQLADPSGFLTLGLRASDVVRLPPMRAIDIVDRVVVQLVEPPEVDARSFEQATDPAQNPPTVAPFLARYERDALPRVTVRQEHLVVPLGIGAADAEPVALELGVRESAMVVAPHGMGRSTALATITEQLYEADPAQGVDVIALGPSRSPFALDVDTAVERLSAVDTDRTTVIVIDDVEWLDGPVADAVHALVARTEIDRRFIVGTTPDGARRGPAWLASIRSDGVGVLLAGTVAEIDIFRTRVDRFHGLGQLPGRGHLIRRGRAIACQLAAPDGRDARSPSAH